MVHSTTYRQAGAAADGRGLRCLMCRCRWLAIITMAEGNAADSDAGVLLLAARLTGHSGVLQITRPPRAADHGGKTCAAASPSSPCTTSHDTEIAGLCSSLLGAAPVLRWPYWPSIVDRVVPSHQLARCRTAAPAQCSAARQHKCRAGALHGGVKGTAPAAAAAAAHDSADGPGRNAVPPGASGAAASPPQRALLHFQCRCKELVPA